MIKTKTGNTIVISSINPYTQKSDIIVNWVDSSLRIGPKCFYEFHKYAGAQVVEATIHFQELVKEGDVFSTIAGWLNYNLAMHGVVPLNGNYSLTWRNFFATLNRYMAENVCREIYIPIHDWENIYDFVQEFFYYEQNIKNIRFIFTVESEIEQNNLIPIFTNLGKDFIAFPTRFDKIDSFLRKIVHKICIRFPLLLSLKNDRHNKEELQKSSSGTRFSSLSFFRRLLTED